MKTIPIVKSNRVVVVDDEDYDDLSVHHWHVTGFYAFRLFTIGNRTTGRTRHTVYMHRQILGAKKGELVDHINHDKLDNRRSNLRLADYSTNGANQLTGAQKKEGASSQYKGVSWDKAREKWVAKIQFHQKHFNLGGYDEERQAGLAYNHAARICFGDFACINQLSP